MFLPVGWYFICVMDGNIYYAADQLCTWYMYEIQPYFCHLQKEPILISSLLNLY